MGKKLLSLPAVAKAPEAPPDSQDFPITKTEALLVEAAHMNRVKSQQEAQRLVNEAEARFREAIVDVVENLNERRGTKFDANPEVLFGDQGAYRPGVGFVEVKAKTIRLAVTNGEVPKSAE